MNGQCCFVDSAATGTAAGTPKDFVIESPSIFGFFFRRIPDLWSGFVIEELETRLKPHNQGNNPHTSK
ncbi:hypothetical protein ACFL1Z_07025 [Thermodesulfobacteriota bacterium]